MARDTYKYHFKKGNKIVHTGITSDLERRDQERKQPFAASGHIKKVGNVTTRDAALKWESEQAKKVKPYQKKLIRINPDELQQVYLQIISIFIAITADVLPVLALFVGSPIR